MPADRTRLPLAVWLPSLAAAMIFAVAVGTSQVAMMWMFRQQEEQVRRLASVYLDGLATAVQPYAAAADPERMGRVAATALALDSALGDRRIVILSADGTQVLAEAASPDFSDVGAVSLERPLDRGGTQVAVLRLDLDQATLVAEQRSMRLLLVGADLALSAGLALLGFLLIRRKLRPVALMTRRLESAQSGLPSPVPMDELPPAGTEFGRLLRGYNRLVSALREREELTARLAEQEKSSVLGRLAATVAHEVRNPLGGMLNAVETLRRFGHDAAAREQSLSLLERGLRSIEAVVSAVLETHRGSGKGRKLSPEDIQDLRLLTEPEARKRGLALDWASEVRTDLPLDATHTRQILLNLLLNACAASPPGGRIRFEARTEGESLRIVVADQGPGMPEGIQARFSGPADATASGGGMGVAVVMRLVESLRGRVGVRSVPGSGTEVTLELPLAPTEEKAA